ncbi:unnamed protein product, partial [Notodromas monacha]
MAFSWAVLASCFGQSKASVVQNSTNKTPQQAYHEGAVLIDVRTPEEFALGHMSGSINIPLQIIDQNIAEIRIMKKPVVLVCRSGRRSAQAQSILLEQGLTE